MEDILYSDWLKRVGDGAEYRQITVGFVDDPKSIYSEEVTPMKTGEFRIVEMLSDRKKYRVWKNAVTLSDVAGLRRRGYVPQIARIPLVIIESPYAGNVEANKAYLKRCVLDSLSRGESPYASHGFFTQFLDDLKPDERTLGIEAGLAWSKVADYVAFYVDRGMSNGMNYAMEQHKKAGRRIEIRKLDSPE